MKTILLHLVLLSALSSFGQGSSITMARNPVVIANCYTEILPTSITNLVYWFKADDGPVGGPTINTWLDQSGNDFDATQNTATNCPVLRNNAINGLPAVDFGVNVKCSLTNRTAGARVIPFSTITVFYSTNCGTAGGVDVVTAGDAGGGRPYLSFEAPNKVTYFCSSSVGLDGVIGPNWYMVSGSIAKANEITTRFKRSVVYVFGSRVANDNGAALGFTFLRLGDYVTQPLGGMIAEHIMWEGYLTDDQRIGVELYLRKKYQLHDAF